MLIVLLIITNTVIEELLKTSHLLTGHIEERDINKKIVSITYIKTYPLETKLL